MATIGSALSQGLEAGKGVFEAFTQPYQEAKADTEMQKLFSDPANNDMLPSAVLKQGGMQLIKNNNTTAGMKLLDRASIVEEHEARTAKFQAESQAKTNAENLQIVNGIAKLPEDQQAPALIDAMKEISKKASPAEKAFYDRAIMTITQNPANASKAIPALQAGLTSESMKLKQMEFGIKIDDEDRKQKKDAEDSLYKRSVIALGQQKLDKKDQAYPDVLSGNTTTQSGATIGGSTGIGSDLSKGIQGKITSGIRTNDNLYQESVDAGRPGKTAEGRPIAKPGTSQHEKENALDISPKALTKEDRAELAQKGYYQPLSNDSVHWERIPGYKAPESSKQETPATSTPQSQGEAALSDKNKVQQIANYVNKDVKTASQRVDTGTLKSTLKDINPSEWAALDTPKAVQTVSGGLDAARQASKIKDFVIKNKVQTGFIGEMVKKMDKYDPNASAGQAINQAGFAENEQILGKLILDFSNAYARSERGGATPMATVAELKAAMTTFGVSGQSPASVASSFGYIAENKLNKLSEQYFGGNRNAILIPNQTVRGGSTANGVDNSNPLLK